MSPLEQPLINIPTHCHHSIHPFHSIILEMLILTREQFTSSSQPSDQRPFTPRFASRPNNSVGSRKASHLTFTPIKATRSSPSVLQRRPSESDIEWLPPRQATSFASASGSSCDPLPVTPSSPLSRSPALSRTSTVDRDSQFRRSVDTDSFYEQIRVHHLSRKTSYFEMSAASGLKRKVVILGSPSVGECEHGSAAVCVDAVLRCCQ